MKVFIITKKGKKFYAQVSGDFTKQYKTSWNPILRSYTATLTKADLEQSKHLIIKVSQ